MANLNLNKVILGGRLTSDPELKTTQSGVAVTAFTIAISRKAKKGEEAKADFINCTAWRQTAEFITSYFKKGSSICVVGSLQTRNWTTSTGEKRYSTEVLVDEANFVDSKGENTASNQIPSAPAYSAGSTENSSDTAFETLDPSDELPF